MEARTPGSPASARWIDHQYITTPPKKIDVRGTIGAMLACKLSIATINANWNDSSPVSCAHAHCLQESLELQEAHQHRGGERRTPHGPNTQSRLHQHFTQTNPQQSVRMRARACVCGGVQIKHASRFKSPRWQRQASREVPAEHH